MTPPSGGVAPLTTKKITLADVARAAGVAVGTASRVLNNYTDVNSDARSRVLEAVSRLRYEPLRKRRVHRGADESALGHVCNIGVVLLGMDDSLVHVPILGEILHGVEQAVTCNNGNLLLANLPTADRIPGFLLNNQVDGLVVKTSQYGKLPDPADNALVRNILRFPIVWIWARPEGAPGDLCSFNHESAAQIAAAHLHDKGHTRVAFLNPKKGKSSLEHIKKEFKFACADRKMELTLLESSSPRVSTWPEPALKSAEEVIPLIDEWATIPRTRRPTAIFVPADNIAAHLYAACEQRSIRIGQDLSIIACNNEKALVQALKPSLATIEVNAHKIGQKSVEQLTWRLANTVDDSVQTILFEPTLIEGDSVLTLKQR